MPSDVLSEILPESSSGMLSVSVLADAEVTREAVFNALTDNGDRQLIAYGSDGKLYINGEYIKSKTITADLIDVNTLDAIVAKIGGFVVGSSSIHTSGRNSNDVNYARRIHRNKRI